MYSARHTVLLRFTFLTDVKAMLSVCNYIPFRT